MSNKKWIITRGSYLFLSFRYVQSVFLFFSTTQSCCFLLDFFYFSLLLKCRIDLINFSMSHFLFSFFFFLSFFFFFSFHFFSFQFHFFIISFLSFSFLSILFHSIDIPDYRDKETLWSKLNYAVDHAVTFEIV